MLDLRELGKLNMHSFKLESEDGKFSFEPWEGKKAYGWEWMRNDTAMTGYARQERATFYKIEHNAPIYISDTLIQGKQTDVAWFTSSVDGDKFNVAARLVEGIEDMQPGDPVTLTILGCCSLVSVEIGNNI